MLIIAIGFMSLGHMSKILRWEMLIEVYEKPNRKVLIRSLSLGYLMNFVFPLKIGDIFRGLYAGKRMTSGRGLALASVAVDRILDILAVGVIFFILNLCRIEGVKEYYLYYFMLAFFFLLFIIICFLLRKYIKPLIRQFAYLFNENIEVKILMFSWALIWGFKDIIKKINKLKLLLLTIIMWGIYILSYWCFAQYLTDVQMNGNWVDVFVALFSITSVLSSGIVSHAYWYWYSIFYIVPPIILLIVALFAQRIPASNKEYLNLMPQVSKEDRRVFLELYFSGENNSYVENYLKVNRKILVLRDCSAGSNATTILCTDGKNSFYRKYAFGKDADKLYEQIEWIQRYQNIVRLPDIIRFEKEDDYCFYDMPYSSRVVGLFDYAHSNQIEAAWDYVQAVLESMQGTVYRINMRKADQASIKAYINSKVKNNINKIISSKWLKPLMAYDEIIINGTSYKNLPCFMKHMDTDYLLNIFSDDYYSIIHGDLTIENIICTRNKDAADDFYIIDPNTGNIHDSPNLDYAKLLQSVHGNYEFLLATEKIEIFENRLDFVFIKSDAYNFMLKKLDEYMLSHFELRRVKSIYYHEIVHWLRLMPYKIEKSGKRVLLFYAGLLIVINDVIRRFEEELS